VRARVLAEAAVRITREIRFVAEEAWSLLTVGRTLLELGLTDEARRVFEEAVELSREKNLSSPLVLGTCHLARLGAAEVESACALLRDSADQLETHERMEAEFLLYRSGAGRTYLESCRARLLEFEAKLTENAREELRMGVALYREIHDTWAKHG
jgi:hypothetical protein